MGNNDILIGLNNIAPMKLKKLVNQSFYYDVAPTEQMKRDNLSPFPKSNTTLIFAPLCR